MSRDSLVELLAESILDRILRGVYTVDEALPPESALADEAGVSRLTAREALKSLQARKVIFVRRGLGTFVNPVSNWTGLDVILRAATKDFGSDDIALKLLEVRRIIETGAAELAAINHSDDNICRLGETILGMEIAQTEGDLDRLTANDLAFHNIILTSTGNPFLPALMGQLGQLLQKFRRETSAVPEIQEHAIDHHKSVLAAIASGNSGESRRAMDAHIVQTIADYERFIQLDSAEI
jgi:GntR family transcriptional repressor for pyruvate dehydrogenase complex